ncbi:twin-arginine translocation signal domain-containing protein [Acidocella sp. MX-AZ03]|uniref:twin-arginine translocation signal domain-containing protein n=1 Tax=Acidocella sp. MX-AZ03 TaxID=2697363 RepID=UPI003FA44EA6
MPGHRSTLEIFSLPCHAATKGGDLTPPGSEHMAEPTADALAAHGTETRRDFLRLLAVAGGAIGWGRSPGR